MTTPSEISAGWPRSPYDFVDTSLCPSCFSTLTATAGTAGSRCPTCGLPLTDARLTEVLELGTLALEREIERRGVLDRIRADHAEAPAREPSRQPVARATAPDAAPPAAPTSAPPVPPLAASQPVAAPQPVAASQPEVVAAPTPATAPATAPTGAGAEPARHPHPAVAPASPPAGPRRPRLTVPALLLIIGVCLVGVAAIFFVTVAWFVANLQVRALIVGAITASAVVAASLLRRRRLTSTAEAIAVIGVILIGLDAWAVRANALFGTDATDPVAYAGAATLVAAVLLRAWARVSSLRAPDLVSVLALPTGIGLLVAALVEVPADAAAVIALAAASAGTLVHVLPAPWSAARVDAVVERTVLATVGIAALVLAGASSPFVAGDSPPFAISVSVLLTVIGAAHARLLLSRTGATTDASEVVAARPLGLTAATLAAIAATAGGWQLALRVDDPLVPLLVAPVVAVIVAALLDRGGARLGVPRLASAISGAIALLSAAGLLLTSILGPAALLSRVWTIWRTDPLVTPPIDGAFWPLLAALAIGAMAMLAPSLRAGRRPVARDVGIGALAIGGAVHTGIPLAVAIVCGIVAVGGALLALRARSGATTTSVSRTAPALLGAGAGFLLTMTTATLWVAAVAVLVATLVVFAASARLTTPARAGFGVAAVVAGALAAIAAPAAIGALIAAASGATSGLASGATSDTNGAAFALLGVVAVAALCVAAIVVRGTDAGVVIARALVAAGLTVAAVSLIPTVELALPIVAPAFEAGPVSEAIGGAVGAVVRTVLLVTLLGALVLRGLAPRHPDPLHARARVAAAALLAPAVGSLVLAAAAVGDIRGTAPIIAAGAFALLTATAAALVLVRDRDVAVPTTAHVRVALDLSAVTATLLVASAIPAGQLATFLALLSVAVAATSACRGWAAPRSAAIAGLVTARGAGAPTRLARRRLLAWPALAVAVLALWTAVTDAAGRDFRPALEAYTLAPAVALLAFAAALTWLRRHREAAVALTAALIVGLGAGALWPSDAAPLRAIVSTLVAAGIATAAAWTTARRWGPMATAAAWTATAITAAGALQLASGRDAWTTVWLAVPVAVALAAGHGFIRPRFDATRGMRAYALVAPVGAIAVGVLGAWDDVHRPQGAVVGAVALTALLVLHVAASAIGRMPFGAATRWAALAGAVVMAVPLVEVAPAIETLSLPLAAALLAGAALAIARAARTAAPAASGGSAASGVSAAQPVFPAPGDAAAWIAGLAVGIVPSLVAADDLARTWIVVATCLLAAAGLMLAEVPRTASLTAVSSGMLVAGALAMGLRSALASGEAGLLPAIVAGVGAVAIGAVAVTQRRFTSTLSTSLAGAGLAVIAALVLVRSDGSVALTASLTVGGALVAIGGAALLGHPVWRRFAAVTSAGALVVVLVAVASRIALLLGLSPSAEPDLWALAVAVVIATAALVAVRSRPDAAGVRIAGIAFALATAVFALAEIVFLARWADGGGIRTAVVMTATAGAGFAGVLLRARLGTTFAATAASALVVAGLTAVAVGAARPVELVTLAPAAALTVLGVVRLRRDPQARSWPALGAGLGLATLPSLAYDVGSNELWRVVALGVLALALVVVGARRRLQAPLVIGAAVLMVHGIAQLWPWLTDLYTATPWWLWVGVGGILLIVVAARYERQRQSLRRAYDAVTALR